MPSPVKRRYDATRRQQAAARTRAAILEAARELFAERGYAATAMTAIADRAGVALDTVYASGALCGLITACRVDHEMAPAADKW